MFGSWKESLQKIKVRSLSKNDAREVMDELGTMRRMIDGVIAEVAKHLDDPKQVARSLGVPVREVRAAVDTAVKLESLPQTSAAVRDGSLSARQAQLIANAATINPDAEAQLLATAQLGLVPLKDACLAAKVEAEEPAARAARQRAQRRLRMWTDDDGMECGYWRQPPEVGGPLRRAVETEVQKIFRAARAGTEHEPLEAYAADALEHFVLGDAQATVQANVHIIIDHGALMRGGAVDGEVCEIPGVGPVDVNWVRELIGSAFLTAVIKRGKDILTVAHLGRHVPAEVQTALLVSGRECDVEDCHARGYLERDHAHDYAAGGPTAFWNLVWLCYAHHRLKSSGWILGPPDLQTGKRSLTDPRAHAA